MNEIQHIRILDESLDELGHVVEGADGWCSDDDPRILKAMVNVHEVIRDLERTSSEDEYDRLDNVLIDNMEELFTTQDEVRSLNRRVAELEIDIGVFQSKNTVEGDFDDLSIAPFQEGDRVCDNFDGPGTVVDVNHGERTAYVVLDNDYTGFSPTPVSYQHLSILVEEDDEQEIKDVSVVSKFRLTEWGREVYEDLDSLSDHKFRMGDKAYDKLTKRTGEITGYVIEGEDFRYEMTCEDDIFGEWRIYAEAYNLEHAPTGPKLLQKTEEDEIVEWLDPRPMFD